MRYLQWDLTQDGSDPTGQINSSNAYVYPQFRIDNTIYAYWVSGDIDLQAYGQFYLIEITVNDMLKNALSIDSGALVQNDVIQFSTKPEILSNEAKAI